MRLPILRSEFYRDAETDRVENIAPKRTGHALEAPCARIYLPLYTMVIHKNALTQSGRSGAQIQDALVYQACC